MGSLLLELVVSFALIVAIVPWMLSSWLSTTNYMRQQLDEQERDLKTSIIWQAIERDVKAASCFPYDWVYHNHLWYFKKLQLVQPDGQQTDDRWLCWRTTHDGLLYRSEGELSDVGGQVWHHKNSLSLGKHYTVLTIKPSYSPDGLVDRVLITYQKNKKSSSPKTISIPLYHAIYQS